MVPGGIVRSKAGRDKGRIFVIVGVPNYLYVLISDGKLRKIERPKKKKIKHIEPLDVVIKSLGTKLTNMERVTNAEIRKALAMYSDEMNIQ